MLYLIFAFFSQKVKKVKKLKKAKRKKEIGESLQKSPIPPFIGGWRAFFLLFVRKKTVK